MTPDLPSPKAPVSETPKTDALIARHKAETHALETRFPDRGYVVTRHEWRDHSVRQAQELLDHTKDLEREVSSLRAQLSKARDEALGEAANACAQIAAQYRKWKRFDLELMALTCANTIRSLKLTKCVSSTFFSGRSVR
jgi:hypothetical protein